MKKKINPKRIVALGLVATSVCSAPIGVYTNVMAQDIATNENSEEAEPLIISTEPVVDTEQEETKNEEVANEVTEPIIDVEESTTPEAEVSIDNEVALETETVPEVTEEKIVEDINPEPAQATDEVSNSSMQTFSIEDDINNAKEIAMGAVTAIEAEIIYPTTEITNRLTALKEKVNNLTDVSEVDSLVTEAFEISDLAESTIHSCEITYDENYPYEYVNREDLNALNWALYDGNFVVKVVDACGNTIFPLSIIESASYSELENKIICKVFATGKAFVNDMEFIQTVKVPVKQVENVVDKDSELVLAQDEAIRVLKSNVEFLTTDCSAELKAKAIELLNNYIARIKSATSIEEVDNISSEASTNLTEYVMYGGLSKEEFIQYIEDAVVELCKDAENKRKALTDNGKNLFTEMITKAEGDIRKAPNKQTIDNILKEAEDFYKNLKAEEDKVKKELQDAKNAFFAELNAIDVTKYDEADRENLSELISSTKSATLLQGTMETFIHLKETFYESFSNFQTTEDKNNAQLVEAKTKAIAELDALDYSFLNAGNKVKVSDKIALIKISIQSASTISEVNTSVQAVKTYIQTLKSEEEAGAELEGKRTEALAEINGFDLSHYDRGNQTYIKETFKAPAIDKIEKATTVSEINQALTEFQEGVATVPTIEEQVRTEKQNVIKYIDDIVISDLLEVNQVKATTYFEEIKTKINSATTVMAVKQLKGQVVTFMTNLREEDAEQRAEAEALIQAKKSAITELEGIDTTVYDSTDKPVVDNLITTTKTAVNNVKTTAELNTTMQAFRNSLASFKTAEQKEQEILIARKVSATQELDAIVTDDLSTENKTKIESKIVQAKADIQNAGTVVEINAIVQAANDFVTAIRGEEQIEKEFQQLKTSYTTTVNNVKEVDYDEMDRVGITTLKTTALTAFDQATTKEQLTIAMNTFQTGLAGYKTTADKEAEKLVAKKEAAITQIQGTPISHLLEVNQVNFRITITDIVGKIRNADTVGKVDELLSQFQTKLGEINQKDIADRALFAAKETAVNEINEIDLTVYDDTDKANLETQRTEIIRQINGAVSEADVDQLVQDYKDNLRNFETSAEKEAKRLAKAKTDAKIVISEYDISMLAEQFKTKAETVKEDAITVIDNAPTVDDVLQAFNQTIAKLDKIKADDMAAKTLAEAKVSAINQIGTVQITDYDEEDRRAVTSLKDTYLVKIEQSDTVHKVAAALSEFKEKLDKIYTTAKKEEIALDKKKAEATTAIDAMDLSVFSSKYQYIMITYLQNAKTDINLAISIEQVDEILTRAETDYAEMKVEDFNEQVADTETKFDETYKNAISSIDINKIDLSTIKEEAKGELQAYFSVANYRIEQILERVKAEIQKLIDDQEPGIRLMSVPGGYQFVSGTRSADSILGIDISGLTDENKAKAMAIFNKAIAEINQILADTDEYVQSVTKVPEGSTGEENKPSNGGSQPEGTGTANNGSDTNGNDNNSTKVSESRAVKTGDETNPVLPMTGMLGALAGIGYLLRKRKN